MQRLLLLILTIVILGSCKDETNWTSLLDKELSQWDNYLSFKHQIGYDGQAPRNSDGSLISPIGLNQNNYNVFTVFEEGNELVLKISGEIYGCVFTKKEFSNYHLRLKVKWGEKKWDPRKKLLKDSGVLYHSIGAQGVEHWRSWMLSQEFQVMEGHMGDYWNQANSAIDIKAFIPEYIMNPVADKTQSFLPMGAGENLPGFCLRSANYERNNGEWNTLELVCFEDKSLHIVNGQIVMILQNSRYFEKGKAFPMIKGKIQIQSEAAEVYYKNIEIRDLETLPAKYSLYFKEN